MCETNGCMCDSRVFLVLIFFLCCAEDLYASESTLTAEQVRSAMQSERSRIVNGKLRATGTYNIHAGGALEKQGSPEWIYEFDYVNGTFLFDRSEFCDADRDTRSGDSDRLRIFYCEDSHATYAYHDLVLPIAALKVYPSPQPETSLEHYFERLDIRGIGICNGPNLASLSQRGDKFFLNTQQLKRSARTILS
jgi:hypothetical protein